MPGGQNQSFESRFIFTELLSCLFYPQISYYILSYPSSPIYLFFQHSQLKMQAELSNRILCKIWSVHLGKGKHGLLQPSTANSRLLSVQSINLVRWSVRRSLQEIWLTNITGSGGSYLLNPKYINSIQTIFFLN